VLVRWFAPLADRFLAADHGLLRFRFALRAVLSVVLAAAVLAGLRIPVTALLLGCVAAMICSTSMRTGTGNQRALNIVLFALAMSVSVTLASVLSPYRIVSDAVFVAIMFIGVSLRRYDQLGSSIGMGAFMAYFFALYLHATPALLPVMFLAVGIGTACCALMSLVVFRETPAKTLNRTLVTIRAQVARLVDVLAKLLEDGVRLPQGQDMPRAVARQATRMHETMLQIEDNADLLGLAPRWQRQLVDAELSADRLARATVRALSDDLDAVTRDDLAADLRGLHRFMDRNPGPALALDIDGLLLRIARYDILGDPGAVASSPEHHTLLVRRAIRELLLSMVEIRRTTLRLMTEPGDRSWDAAGEGRDEPLEEDADEGSDEGSDVDTEVVPPAPDAPAVPSEKTRGLNPATRAGIQAAIGGALAILGGELLSAQRWYWAVIAGYIVFAGTTSRGDLLVKGWRRVWGTLLGIIAGTVLATLLAGRTELNVVALLACIFLAFYTLRVSYATMTFFITVMLGMLYDILGTFTPDVLLLRLAETAIGVTGSVIAAMLVLPTRTRATVLTELHDYFGALRDELLDAERLLVHADRVSVIAATREVDRAATDVRTAIDPMLHRLSPSRVRRGHATRLLTLAEESSLTARNLARAAEPGALAGIPEAAHTLERLIANTEALLAATEVPPKTARLVSGSELAPRVDVRAHAQASSAGEPDRLQVLHLRRVINALDRLDKLLLGMAAPLAQTVSVPRGEVVPESGPSRRPRGESVMAGTVGRGAEAAGAEAAGVEAAGVEAAGVEAAGVERRRAEGRPEERSAVDARDRLLRVLLSEPGRALHAAEDLLSSRDELDRLDGSQHRSRQHLAAAVQRLRAAGLTSEQIAGLAGFSERELAGLLAEHTPTSPRPAGTGPD
jgi:uncharacterized membrane protein YccC